VPLAGAGLYSPRLEKRSQALQACNLTRNFQADGAPMVHHPCGIIPPGVFFLHHRTPESCLRKRTGIAAPDVSFQPQFGLRATRSPSLRFPGDPCRPCTYRGLSRRKSMKINERSAEAEQVQSTQGDSVERVHGRIVAARLDGRGRAAEGAGKRPR
jgi:hypothetical protein